MKVALVYDRVNKWGGAERVLLTLHEIFPLAPLFTSVCNIQKAKWASTFPQIFCSFLQKIPFAKDNHEYLPFLMPLAFESFNFDDYDLVISVTSEAAKGIITKPSTKHICYCLTPTRYLWSGYKLYFKSKLLKFLARPVVNYLKKWDRIAAQRPDVMIGISNAVCKRIEKYYKRKANLIFPPVNLDIKSKEIKKKEDYFLVVGRLVKYKRVDLVVRVFNKLGFPLVIVGEGKEEKKLKAMASTNISFIKKLTDDELINYYKKCRAVIFAQEEDFGLVAAEAQACGTPVIAYKKGGIKDIVIDGKTGIFFDKQTEDSLESALLKFEKVNFNQSFIMGQGGKFTKERFKAELSRIIKRYVGK